MELEKHWSDINVMAGYDSTTKRFEEKFNRLDAQVDRLEKSLDRLTEMVVQMAEKLETLTSVCQKIDTNLVQQNEREVNLQIRKYSMKHSKEPPLHFVPSSTSGKNHFGLFTGLLR